MDMITLTEWANLHGVSYAYAKKVARSGEVDVVISGSEAKPVRLIARDTIPPCKLPTYKKKRSPHSEETKRKISDKAKGRVLSEQHRSAISNGLTGRQHSSATKEKMSATWSNKTDDEKEEQRRRAKQTNLHRYGYEIASKNADVIDKAKQTSINRYGVHHSQHSEVKRRIRETSERNHDGVFHTMHPLVKAKAQQTNLARYGVKNTMALARAAFIDQYGGNPFTVDWIKEKTKLTNNERYGADHYSKTDEYKNKIIARMRARYGVANFSQRNMSSETMAVLENRDSLTELLGKMPMASVAKLLAVDATTVARYADKHAIDRPRSTLENFVISILRSNDVKFNTSDRTLLRSQHTELKRDGRRVPLELDIVIPDKKLAIEVCGIYWHSELWLDRTYHQRKLKMCEAIGFRLLTIFEDEILLNPDIVTARVKHALGFSEKGPPARKLRVEAISGPVAKSFYDLHHTQQGAAIGNTHYGAFHDDVLVAAMSFGPTRISMGGDGQTIELIRFVTNGTSMIGVANKLFRAYMRDHDTTTVISYADRRWSSGDVYEKMGFRLTAVSRPSYHYITPDGRRLHRYQFRKERIQHLVENGSNKTEHEIMIELGFIRIYDCGHLRYTYEVSHSPDNR